MFDIRFIYPVVDGSQLGNAALLGRIVLDDYEEDFISLIGFWSPRDYEAHWQAAIRRLVSTRANACLITSLHDPTEADIGRWWLLYPDANDVHVQEALLPFRDLAIPFSTAHPYDAIPPRHTHDANGAEISEWTLPLNDFVRFLER